MSEDAFRWVVAAAVILACLAFVAQAAIVFAMYRIAQRLQGRILPLADRAEPILTRVEPILDNARGILEESRPRIAEMTGDAVVVTKTAREQAEQWRVVLDDAAARARVRIEQIDEKVDETVQQVEQVGEAMKTAVTRPMREVNAILAGIKAAVATYVQGGRRPSVDHATQDEEMFI
jgi:methyl-accepting chemotaxis protein